MRRAVTLSVASMAAAALTVAILAGLAMAAPSSDEIVSSLDVPVSTVTATEAIGDPRAVATLSEPISGFPIKGSDYLVISTGIATALPGNPEEEASTDLNGAGSADNNDLTQVKLTLVPPASATCVAFDFAFLSEEYPEYVGPEFEFNDIFTAERNESKFILEADQVNAPNNFARDSQGNAVSIDTVFGMSQVPGTVMDGSTPPLTASGPVEKKPDGSMDLFLSVQDLGDSVLDSAAIIDNLRWFSEPNCIDVVTTVDPTTAPPATVDPTQVPPAPVPPTSVSPTRVDPAPIPPVRVSPVPASPTLVSPTSAPPASVDSPPVDPTSVAPTPVPPPPDPGNPGGYLNRAYMATQVPSPTDVFNDPGRLLLGLLLAVLLVPVVAFPAEFFESTYEKNRATIAGWFRWVPRLPRLNLSYWLQLGIFGLVAAALLMIVIPEARFDEATLAQGFGFLLAVPLVVVALEVPGKFYPRRERRSLTPRELRRQREQQWSVLPSALILAGFLALLSRLADFSPPYVYGLIAVYLGADQLLKNLNEWEEKKERGRSTLIGMLCLFAASVIAWFVWIPLDRAFDREVDGFVWLIADAFLPTFFLLGLETAVFAMMPLTFLKGKEVWQWKPAVWAVVFLPISFVFLSVQFAVRETADLTLAGTIKAIALFVAFGIFSFVFWAYFHPGVRRWFSVLVRS